jgi:hypothetical protein
VPDRFAERFDDASLNGGRCKAPVSLAALPATILDLTGVAKPAADDDENVAPFPSNSLMSVWQESLASACVHCDSDAAPIRMQVKGPPGGPLPCQGHSPVAGGEMEATITGHTKRIRHADGHEEVYDLPSDAAEERNLAEHEIDNQ